MRMIEMRRRYEVVDMEHQLELSLRSVNISYTDLTSACDTTVSRLEKEIEPEIERSHRDAKILGVYANVGFLAGGILSGVGILATPFTAGTSLTLTTAGATLMCAGGATAVGTGIYKYVVTKINFEEAKELLDKFRKLKMQLCRKLLRLHEICETIAGMRNQRTYEAIFSQLFPEYNMEYKTAKLLLENFQVTRLFDIMQSSNGGVNVAKGVFQFVKFVEELAKKGQKITKTVVVKFLIPLGIVIDSAFLIASIQQLRENKKCEAAMVVELIKDIIQEEMSVINDLCPGLRSDFFRANFSQMR